MQLWRETAVNAEKLLVHDCSEGKGAERRHARIVDTFRVFAFTCDEMSTPHARVQRSLLTFKFEREVISQVAAFVITPQKEERVRVPDFQCPQVKDTL